MTEPQIEKDCPRDKDGKRLYCWAIKGGPGKTGRCKLKPGQGTPHPGYGTCKHHLGCTPAGIKSAAREMLASEGWTYGGPTPTTATEALIQEVHRTAGIVEWLGFKIAAMEEHELSGPVGPEGETELGVTYHPGERPNVYIELFQRERAHLVRACKAALDAGVQERLVKLAEDQGKMLAEAIRAILTDLGVADDPKAPTIVRRHLMALSGGDKSA